MGWYKQAAAAYSFLISSFFFLSNFQTLKFLSNFSQELWGLEAWNLLHMWTVGRCIMFTGIRLLLLLIHPLFIFFLSNFQTFKFFVALFSGTVRPRRLKLGTHMEVGRCIVYTGIRLLLLIHPFFFSVFFLSNFQTFLSHFSQKLWGVDNWWMYHVYRNEAAASYLSLILSLQC